MEGSCTPVLSSSLSQLSTEHVFAPPRLRVNLLLRSLSFLL
jgi:hypothetical protein